MKLKPGDAAPEFTTKDQDGSPVSLKNFRGKKVILYFYPNDMTPGCTAESCSLRDNYKALQAQGYVVLGISTNDEKSHRKFIEKESLPFSLLADVDKSVHQKYGTWVKKSMYGREYMGTARVTFVIDEKGTISEVIEKVDTRNHASQILSPGTSTKASVAPASKPKSMAKPTGRAAAKRKK
jgi:peroxiredoxin Q/BCP